MYGRADVPNDVQQSPHPRVVPLTPRNLLSNKGVVTSADLLQNID